MPANTSELGRRRTASLAPYSSKIIKAGALIADTKTLLSHWDVEASVSENLKRLQRENVFGKASRSRVEDILAIFRQRYLIEESVTRALVVLALGKFATDALDRLFYFHSARADQLLHDVVTKAFVPMRDRGLIPPAGPSCSAAKTMASTCSWCRQRERAARSHSFSLLTRDG
jgi:hypothetical protein